ncbi:hypothetical protein GmHk_08G023365 [Glycine max]|nr:hypothetical protein GmHk_08G023365 [Glycine max]
MSYESEPMVHSDGRNVEVEHKCDKREGSTRTNSHRSNKRHKHDKCEPFPKGPRYEHYTTLTTNRATILEEAFSMEVPIQLPLIPPPRLCLDRTKHYRYHCNHGHNTEDYWALKDKIKFYARNLLTTWMSYESEPMVHSDGRNVEVEHKCDKREGSTRTNSHRSNKRHKHDKCEPFPKGPRYEHYTTLTTNRATILEEAFSMEVPIQLPLIPPPRLCLDRTKHYRHHCNHGHNTEDYWALKDKIKCKSCKF